MPELNNPLANLDLSGSAISQIDAFGGHLRRQIKDIYPMSGRWLTAISAAL